MEFIQALAIKLILVLPNQNQNDLKQDHLKTAESEPIWHCTDLGGPSLTKDLADYS